VKLFSTAGQFDKVFGSGVVAYIASAQASFVGGDDSIRASGSDDQLKLYSTAGAYDKAFGAGLVANLANAQSSFVDGGDVIRASGAGDAVKLFATLGVADKVYGQNLTAYLVNAQASFVQGGDSIHLLNGQDDSLKLFATGANADTVYGSDSVISVIGSQATINGSDDQINMFGDDTVSLNGESHAFVYQPAIGESVVNGFDASDTIQFSAQDFASFSALQGNTQQVGANTVITLDANDTLTLTNVLATSLSAAQFKFA